MGSRSKSEWQWSFGAYMKNAEAMPDDRAVSLAGFRHPDWHNGRLTLWVKDEISQLRSEDRHVSMDMIYDMEPNDRDEFIAKIHARQADELMTMLRVMWRMEVA